MLAAIVEQRIHLAMLFDTVDYHARHTADFVRPGMSLNDGDVIAFSGPVPYSYGYGAPIV